MSQDQKIVLVTGGNTGIGYEIVKALYRSDQKYHILLSGRTLDKVVQAIEEISSESPSAVSNIEPMQLDIEDDVSIENAVKRIRTVYGRLDVLINNAGAAFDGKIKTGEMTMREAWLKAWDVNVVGAQVLTEALVPEIIASKDCRIIFVSSGTANLTDHGTNPRVDAVPSAGWPKPDFRDGRSYRSTKVGLNMMMREWFRFFKQDEHVKVFCVSPGLLATGLAGIGIENMRKMGAGDASIGGQLIRDIVEGQRDRDEGLVVRSQGVQPW